MAGDDPIREAVNWGRLVIEGILIVISILLVFGIEAAWQGRNDRLREATFLARFDSDLESAREALLVVQGGQEEMVADLSRRDRDERVERWD